MTVQNGVSALDLRIDEAREARKALDDCIESLAHTAPEDVVKVAMVLREAAKSINRIATALCLIKPESERS